jgi:hypothetical protein
MKKALNENGAICIADVFYEGNNVFLVLANQYAAHFTSLPAIFIQKLQ